MGGSGSHAPLLRAVSKVQDEIANGITGIRARRRGRLPFTILCQEAASHRAVWRARGYHNLQELSRRRGVGVAAPEAGILVRAEDCAHHPASGDAFQRRFMTSAAPGTGDDEDTNEDELSISFTVFPGFRVSESVVESLVYIVDRPKALDSTTPVTPGPLKLIKGTGEHSLLQKIRSKFTRKKTLVKGTSVAESNNGTMTPPPPTPPPPTEQSALSIEEEKAPSREDAALPLESAVEESAPSTAPIPVEEEPIKESDDPSPSLPNVVTDSYEATDSYVAPYSLSIDDDNRLYIPRALKLSQSPVRSPRLSSVD